MRWLIDLVLPPACAGCGAVGSLFCAACSATLRAAGSGAEAFVVPDPSLLVGEACALALGAFAYEGALRHALARLKYAGVARLAGSLALAADPAFGRLVAITGRAVVVPVPLHLERERSRGYNQAALLARDLAARRGLRSEALLVRTSATERQHRLDRASRIRNLRDAIRVRPGVRLPTVAVVVDDILTTGATMEACASVLRSAGVREVYGFCVAREV